jgi:hypothetical protein
MHCRYTAAINAGGVDMSILMNSRTDELAEARALLAALGRCELRNDGDRRFLESWRGLLGENRRRRRDRQMAASGIAPRGSELRHWPGRRSRRTDDAEFHLCELKNCPRVKSLGSRANESIGERLLCSFEIEVTGRTYITAICGHEIGDAHKLPSLSAELIEVIGVFSPRVFPRDLCLGFFLRLRGGLVREASICQGSKISTVCDRTQGETGRKDRGGRAETFKHTCSLFFEMIDPLEGESRYRFFTAYFA